MDVLRIDIELGPSASPAALESIVRAVRVAVEVGRTALLASLRRTATERMRFPTDSELGAASERLPGGAEQSLSYRATDFARLRARLRSEYGDLPPEFYWRRGPRRSDAKKFGLAGSNFDRIAEGSLAPWWSAMEVGLDVLDPELHAALVGDAVRRQAPTPITVRELTYRNPFGEELTAVGTGVEALNKAAGVIETTATLGSRRKIMRAEAKFAEETVDDRIAMSRVDRELRHEELRRVQLENAKVEEELIALRIQNANALGGLSDAAKQRALVERLTASGQLEEADAAAALNITDAAALAEFAAHPPELERSYEADPQDSD